MDWSSNKHKILSLIFSKNPPRSNVVLDVFNYLRRACTRSCKRFPESLFSTVVTIFRSYLIYSWFSLVPSGIVQNVTLQ
jgi:hypothetical protein